MLPFDAGAYVARLHEIELETWRGFNADASAASAMRRQARLASEQRKALKRALGDYLRRLAAGFGFELVIPGNHGSISNQGLFDVLAERGFAYGADTRRLHDYVKIALLNEFEDDDVVPLRFEVEQTVAGAVTEWVARRLDRTVTDVALRPLSPAYARAKRKRFGTGRAGSASGDLAAAVRRARVLLT